MSDYYDREGNPITMEQWAQLFEDRNYKVVEQTHLENTDVMVSTVWLGLNHGWGGDIRIFETMIFGGPLDQEQHRYATEAEARFGHTAAVKLATYARHAELGESE